MTCIWRIHGSKPYIVRWSLVYNTSVFCFSHFHLEGWVVGLSQMKLTSFEKKCHILRRSLTLHDAISCETSYVFVVLMIIRFPVFLFLELIATFFHTDVSNLQGVAESLTEVDYQHLSTLKNSRIWVVKQNLKSYIGKEWLANDKH